MSLRSLSVVLVVLALAAAACGDDDGDAAVPSESDDTVVPVDGPTTTAPGEVAGGNTTQVPTTTQSDEPAADEPAGDAVGSATLTIGEETWNFDRVEFCAMPTSPDTSSFVLVAKLGEWQLIAEVVDASGAQRLEGDGVYDTISFQNNDDPTLSWLANLEAAEVKFIVIEGSSVKATTTFDAVTGLADDTPGTLEATCP